MRYCYDDSGTHHLLFLVLPNHEDFYILEKMFSISVQHTILTTYLLCNFHFYPSVLIYQRIEVKIDGILNYFCCSRTMNSASITHSKALELAAIFTSLKGPYQ